MNELAELSVTGTAIFSAIIPKHLMLGARKHPAAHGCAQMRSDVRDEVYICISTARLAARTFTLKRKADVLMETLRFHSSHREQIREVRLAGEMCTLDRL